MLPFLRFTRRISPIFSKRVTALLDLPLGNAAPYSERCHRGKGISFGFHQAPANWKSTSSSTGLSRCSLSRN